LNSNFKYDIYEEIQENNRNFVRSTRTLNIVMVEIIEGKSANKRRRKTKFAFIENEPTTVSEISFPYIFAYICKVCFF